VLQVVVVIGCAVIGLSRPASLLRIASPIVLLLGGVPLAFLPWTSDLPPAPELVLLVFLPALLYWESLTTSLREIRQNLRVVVLSAVALVLATAAAVAVVGHALGSLINDGTALVVFALALSVAIGEQTFSCASAIGAFALSYIGGAVAGLVVAWLAVRARNLVRDPIREAAVSLLTPFVAFLLAEEIHASGVLAVVVCGLTLSQVGPRVIGARTRLLTEAFWRVTTFVLNGTLFVLVGLQLRRAVDGLQSTSLAGAAVQALLISAVVIGTRVLWSNTTPYIIRVLDRRPQQRLRRVGFRQRQPMAWAGFRGGVSLAAALAIPHDIPSRDLVVLITFGVVERVRADYEEHLHVLADPLMPTDDPALAAERGEHADDQRLRAALIAVKRAAVVRLRDARKIDDIVLRRLLTRLDAEEVRLSAPSPEPD